MPESSIEKNNAELRLSKYSGYVCGVIFLWPKVVSKMLSHLGIWFNIHGGVRLRVEFTDLRVLFQAKTIP